MLTQVHCHQHAVLGWGTDEKLLAAAGAQPEHLETGCCGLAGSFGCQVGHGEVREACAERALLPRLRDATPRRRSQGKERRFVRKALPTVLAVGPAWQQY